MQGPRGSTFEMGSVEFNLIPRELMPRGSSISDVSVLFVVGAAKWVVQLFTLIIGCIVHKTAH